MTTMENVTEQFKAGTPITRASMSRRYSRWLTVAVILIAGAFLLMAINTYMPAPMPQVQAQGGGEGKDWMADDSQLWLTPEESRAVWIMHPMPGSWDSMSQDEKTSWAKSQYQGVLGDVSHGNVVWQGQHAYLKGR